MKYPQAAAACTKIGATLCSETEWHRAGSVTNPDTGPLTASDSGTLIEAEGVLEHRVGDRSGGTTRTWGVDPTPDFSGSAPLPRSSTAARTSRTRTPDAVSARRLPDDLPCDRQVARLGADVRREPSDNGLYAGVYTDAASPLTPSRDDDGRHEQRVELGRLGNVTSRRPATRRSACTWAGTACASTRYRDHADGLADKHAELEGTDLVVRRQPDDVSGPDLQRSGLRRRAGTRDQDRHGDELLRERFA